MDKQVDFITYFSVIDAQTGDLKIERTTGQYTAHTLQAQTFGGAKVDPTRTDPTLANFYEPKADDEKRDG